MAVSAFVVEEGKKEKKSRKSEILRLQKKEEKKRKEKLQRESGRSELLSPFNL